MSDDTPDAFLDGLESWAQSVAIGKLQIENPVMFQLLTSLKKEIQDTGMRILDLEYRSKQAEVWSTALWNNHVLALKYASDQRVLLSVESWLRQERYRQFCEMHPIKARLRRWLG